MYSDTRRCAFCWSKSLGPHWIRIDQMTNQPICKKCRRPNENLRPKTLAESRIRFGRYINSLPSGILKRRPRFKTLLHKFTKNKLSNGEIGRPYELSREMVRRIRKWFFVPFLSERNGRDAYYLRIRKAKISRKKALMVEKKKLTSSLLRRINRNGYEYQIINVLNRRNGAVSASVVINSFQCRFSKLVAKNRAEASHQSYLRLTYNNRDLDSFDFLIIQIGSHKHRFLIVPTNVLPRCSGSIRRGIYIKSKVRPAYKNHHQDLDLLKYEECWSLLRRKRREHKHVSNHAA